MNFFSNRLGVGGWAKIPYATLTSIFQLLLLGRCLLHLSRASRCTGQNFDLADLIFVKIGFRLDRICQRIIKTLPKAQQTQGSSAPNKVIAFKSYRNYQNSASKSWPNLSPKAQPKVSLKVLSTKIQLQNFRSNFSLRILTKIQFQSLDQTSVW